MLEKLINQGLVLFHDKVAATYSGVSKRLRVIKWEYFEGIYKDLVDKIEDEVCSEENKQLHRLIQQLLIYQAIYERWSKNRWQK